VGLRHLAVDAAGYFLDGRNVAADGLIDEHSGDTIQFGSVAIRRAGTGRSIALLLGN
jgi:hypothetical protein